MRDVSKGGGMGWKGLQRNVHITFLMDKIDTRVFPEDISLLQSRGLEY